ncbi:MAG: AI-2E family transporter, partial [Lachnospiraceae bacterium]|nr:AI-2E family transporter [Lachnospiraceae bacterium]
MEKKSLKDAPWFPNAVAIVIGVVVFIFLWWFPQIWESIKGFIGYFSAVIIGCVIAYIVNPLALFFEKTLKFIKKDKRRRLTSNILAFTLVILFIVILVVILIPQLVSSIETFGKNFNGYRESLNRLINNIGLAGSLLDIRALVSSSENILSTVVDYLKDNKDSILSVSASAGKGVVDIVIAFILSIYLVAEKVKLKAGFKRLLKAIFGEKRYPGVSFFLHKCDQICNQYLVFSLIDAIIIGVVNAIFMSVCSMEYVGLISFVVGITNLIPTFGPIIGAVIGGFILLMVKPFHAVLFIAFTLILQALDGYVIKPRLFGNSLGVSGLWILIGIAVGSKMFGVIGILLAIPAVAIIDFIY